MSGLHVDMYKIRWHSTSVEFWQKVYEGDDLFESVKDCWTHGHTYVYYTPPHLDGECPDPPAFGPVGKAQSAES